MSLFIFGQYKHSLALLQHPSIPRCVECSFSFNTARWVIGTTTRFPLKINPSCTVISFRMLKYGLTSGSRCILSSGHPSTISCCNCCMLLSSFIAEFSSSSLLSVTGIYSASLTSSSNSLIMLSECWLMNSFTWETLATILNFSLLTVMSAIFWIASAPSKGWKSSFTMTNLTAYSCPVLGFIILTQHSPSGFTSALFHTTRVLFECSIIFLITCFSFSMFTDAPLPSWKAIGFPFTIISTFIISWLTALTFSLIVMLSICP